MPIGSAVVRLAPLTLVAIGGCASEARQSPDSLPVHAPAIAVTNATLIDATGAPPRSDVTIVVRGDSIVAVGPSASTAVPPNARVVDGRGKYVIPGLWDMHTHVGDAGDVALRLYAATGVTGIRDAGGDLDSLKAWRARITGGAALGPRMVIAGPQLDSVAWPDTAARYRHWRIVVHDSAEGAAAVAALQAAGVDYIKAHNLGREAYLGLATEARRRGIPFAGHVSDLVTTVEAVEAGQRSLEHSWGYTLDASSRRDELRAALRRHATRAAPGNGSDRGLGTWPADSLARLSIDSARAAALFDFLAAHEVWVTPTLATERSTWFATEDSVRNDPRLRYLPAALRTGQEGADTSHPPLAVQLKARKELQRHLQFIGAMHRHGVKLLAGTDLGYAYVIPGFSVHDELALFVQAGLSPMAALQTATRNVGQYLGDSTVGAVAVGHRADLVLLDADPLQDIRNVQRVAAVVLQGRLLDRAQREAVLRELEERAARSM